MANEWHSTMQGILDGHVHMGVSHRSTTFWKYAGLQASEQTVLVSIQDPESGSGLPQSLYMKARHPDQFYVFAGLNHATKLSNGKVKVLIWQSGRYICCDGLRRHQDDRMQTHLTPADEYPGHRSILCRLLGRVEELGLPVAWHVNDPEEFWEPEKLPAWARERKWGYGPEDVQKEQLYAEVDEVLDRHPDLNIIFAHFYFLSADLPRASDFWTHTQPSKLT